MNRQRRKELQAVVAKMSVAAELLDEIQSALASIVEQEEEAWENMPEGLQNSERGETMGENLETMQEALEALEELRLDDMAEELDEIAN